MDLPSPAQKLSPEIEFLYGLRGGRARLGLESTRRLLRLMGFPEAGMRIVQVAGTNGQTTVGTCGGTPASATIGPYGYGYGNVSGYDYFFYAYSGSFWYPANYYQYYTSTPDNATWNPSTGAFTYNWVYWYTYY